MKRYVLLGDGESPHLLKWARALTGRVDLHVVSSRRFAQGFDALLPAARRLALNTQPAFEGGNAGVLHALPRLGRWLRGVDADWIHAHYLTSHGTLAWLARRLYGLRAQLIGSAWGSDILVAPQRSAVLRWLTGRVLHACAVTTSDSEHMAARMRSLGAREVMVFPFGLDTLPPEAPDAKQERLCFANRTLEALYAPQRVLALFSALVQSWPDAQLVVANDGSLCDALQRMAAAAPWQSQVRFVGKLDADAQAQWYRTARWYFSLPTSDSVSVSVLEAMAHGCVPVLSDLPANRELVHDGINGVIAADSPLSAIATIQRLAPRAPQIAAANRAWIAGHALFPQAVERFLQRLDDLEQPA